MAKKSASKSASKRNDVPGAPRQVLLPSDFGKRRQERIRQGVEILNHLDESLLSLRARKTGMFPSSNDVSVSTRNRYLREIIQNVASEQERDEKDVRLDVNLGELARLLRLYCEDELSDALHSSKLPLTKLTLKELLGTPIMQLEEAIRKLLDEQL